MLLFLTSIAGSAALLVYAVRMVRTGVERAFARPLRHWLRVSSRNRLFAALSGAAVALLMQGSTAVAVLAAGFVAAGSITAGVGLSILLGADVGSALAVQALVLRPAWLAPLLLLLGVSTFLRAEGQPARQIGRILVGLALVFVALDMITAASTPLRDHPGLATAASWLRTDPVAGFLIGAALAWVIHSSIAAILLVMVLAGQGLLPPSLSLALVLGANLGSSLIAVGLTLGADIPARRMVWTNVAVRGGGAAATLTALTTLAPDLTWLSPTPARQVVNLHLAFNAATALLALPFVTLLLRAMALVLPTPATPLSLADRATALDPQALDDPDRALANATRAVLHMGEIAEAMLRPAIRLFTYWDQPTADAIAAAELDLDRMNLDTKTYLARIAGQDADPAIRRRVAELVEQAAHFEAAGDAVARITFGLARKMRAEGLSLSAQGLSELADFHDQVLANAQAALHVQMTGNSEDARALVAEKERVRHVEQTLQRTHLDRLRQGNPDSLMTSSIHQEALRELKQINTCFILVAYPILTETGDLLDTRLRDTV
jgi:phosphate:Na+ symporter